MRPATRAPAGAPKAVLFWWEEFRYFGNADFRNTGAPSVNHRIYGDGSFQIVERVRDSVQSGGSRCRRLGSSTDWLNTVKDPGKKSPYATYSAEFDICQEFAL